MACVISSKCVNCEMCEPDCPRGAISFNGKTFVIDPALCQECSGFYPAPQCISVCPVKCIKRESELPVSGKAVKSGKPAGGKGKAAASSG
ncbi:4Fe-4S dicluster domain-containing protein [Succinimonas sp.]|uniref:4Fe-4S dicluster domain-containing protein n=1 Tax=Succinimonas sp. TaxID=1936151 RepID=UPI00386F5791